jgi:hypothetical protein
MRRETMPRRRIAVHSGAQTALPPGRPNQGLGAEEALIAQAFGIDDYAASPWIGLHYRHELLLHCNHELLEHQQRKD